MTVDRPVRCPPRNSARASAREIENGERSLRDVSLQQLHLEAIAPVAGTGADMSRFPSAGHLASWAAGPAGHNESARRVNSTQPVPAAPISKARSEWPRCPRQRH
jgi:hypothetical protein